MSVVVSAEVSSFVSVLSVVCVVSAPESLLPHPYMAAMANVSTQAAVNIFTFFIFIIGTPPFLEVPPVYLEFVSNLCGKTYEFPKILKDT